MQPFVEQQISQTMFAITPYNENKKKTISADYTKVIIC